MKIIAIILLVLSQVLDYHSTMKFLANGYSFEANYFILRLQEKFGASKAMIIKGLLHGLLIIPIILLPWWVSVGLLPYFAIYAKTIWKNYKL